MPLVVDASVGLKWVLAEPDSHLAKALAVSDEVLLVPDFWLNEACSVLWLQVRRKILTPDEAREGLGLLRASPSISRLRSTIRPTTRCMSPSQ